MKKLNLLAVLTLTISLLSYSQQYGWVDLSGNIPGEPQSLYDMYFVSEDTGWISTLSSPTIFFTADGGQTFVVQDNDYNTVIQAIYMLDGNNGYAGGASGLVYKTTNGNDWSYYGTMGGSTITDITFPPNSTTDSTGYGCGVNGKTFKVTIYGVEEIINNIASNLKSISFPSATEGWLCGENVIRGYSNGSWDTLDQYYTSGAYNSVYFVAGTTQGWCVGDEGAILHTTDGMNWQGQINPDPAQNILYSVFFRDTLSGWAVGTSGIILHTSDGGENWELQDAGTTNNLSRVFEINSTVYVTGVETLLKFTANTSVGEDLETIMFHVYPNPAVDKIHFVCSELKKDGGMVEIFSMEGRMVWEKEVKKGNGDMGIDLQDLQTGMYLCKITINNKSSSKKIIIE